MTLDLSGCKGSEFTDTLAKIKETPGRRYNGGTKLWELPADPSTAERVILAIQPDVSPDIKEWARSARQQTEQELVARLPEDGVLSIPWANERADWQPLSVNGEPFYGLKPHQRALVAALAEAQGVRAIVADDMGLGKTAAALSAVAEQAARYADAGIMFADDEDQTVRYYTGDLPRLIVCPNSVKGVWAREIVRWLGPGEPHQIVDGRTLKARHKQVAEAEGQPVWVITNYEHLRVQQIEKKLRNGGVKTVTVMKEPLFEKIDWFAVIADEAHRAKNRKASATKGLHRISAPLMIAATGTPLMNTPDELWSLLHWLFPKEYTSYWRFYEQYVDYVEGYFGKDIIGVKNPEALRFELSKRLYRRTKGQVLDLPEKMRVTIPVYLSDTQRALYDQAELALWLRVEKEADEGDKSAEQLIEGLAAGASLYKIPNGAARTVRLRQILSTPALLGGDDVSAKLDAVVDNITDNAHKQHVVFCEFVETCNILAERLRKKKLTAETYTGNTEEHARTRMEDAFQNGDFDVIVGTIGAMREGITLTKADTQHWVERAWVPGWNEQGEDRNHRIGQRNAVTIYIYDAVDSVDDERVKPTNRIKEKIVKTVLPKDHIEEVVR